MANWQMHAQRQLSVTKRQTSHSVFHFSVFNFLSLIQFLPILFECTVYEVIKFKIGQCLMSVCVISPTYSVYCVRGPPSSLSSLYTCLSSVYNLFADKFPSIFVRMSSCILYFAALLSLSLRTA